jgi:hypothetical protein
MLTSWLVSLREAFSSSSSISTTMETQYRVAVAHYGPPTLEVKHWAIVVMLDSENGLVYQITGSTTTYELKPIESITLLDSATYLGKVHHLFHHLAHFFLHSLMPG